MAASWLKIYVRNARSSWLFLMTLINNWVSPWSTGLEARAFLRIPPSLVPKDPLFGGPDGFMALKEVPPSPTDPTKASVSPYSNASGEVACFETRNFGWKRTTGSSRAGSKAPWALAEVAFVAITSTAIASVAVVAVVVAVAFAAASFGSAGSSYVQ
eukprot:CAMPEP_0170544340 /NCGR_PEP_ID=MMETSP0211-20121228/3138_1 /TAXON_ID=311385 /ORGANISM="Pseudokeronopsis sp., Strain OXSARD2" /LENGTH=156 /DNA_ID=CAMNT_0010847965 /DNA_START=877 /DNA_END=1348 /DNA_ORIENTATION=-